MKKLWWIPLLVLLASVGATQLGPSGPVFTIRTASGSLTAGEITTAIGGMETIGNLQVQVKLTTLTLADADDELDIYIQSTYNANDTTPDWCDLRNFHFSNAAGDNGATPIVEETFTLESDGPGAVLSITGTDPAAGAEISETVPANTIWWLQSMHSTFVTDVTVPVRQAILFLDDGSADFYVAPTSATQAASLSRRYTFAHTGENKDLVAIDYFIPIPAKTTLAAGYRVRTVTSSIVAGDNWGAPQLKVEAWHDPAICTDATMGDHLKAYRPLGSQIRLKTVVTGATAPTYDFSATAVARPIR